MFTTAAEKRAHETHHTKACKASYKMRKCCRCDADRAHRKADRIAHAWQHATEEHKSADTPKRLACPLCGHRIAASSVARHQREHAARTAQPSAVITRASAIHGKGAFARVGIPAGTVLGVYAGRKLSQAQFDKRYPGGFGPYVVGEADEARGNVTYIDGSDGGNWARFINGIYGIDTVANVELTRHAQIRSVESIAKGDELLLDYGTDYWDAAAGARAGGT